MLKKYLAGLGFAPGRTDGYYSEETTIAVKGFQQNNGPAANWEN